MPLRQPFLADFNFSVVYFLNFPQGKKAKSEQIVIFSARVCVFFGEFESGLHCLRSGMDGSCLAEGHVGR